jgi:hypothetical protein
MKEQIGEEPIELNQQSGCENQQREQQHWS